VSFSFHFVDKCISKDYKFYVFRILTSKQSLKLSAFFSIFTTPLLLSSQFHSQFSFGFFHVFRYKLKKLPFNIHGNLQFHCLYQFNWFCFVLQLLILIASLEALRLELEGWEEVGGAVMGRDQLLLATVGPPLKRRAGLRRKQAGRGSYRGS
jgi:hypothetical protein